MELLTQLVVLLTPVIGGKLTEWLTDGIKKVAGFVATAPAWVKQATALAVAAALAWGAAYFNAPQIIDGDPGMIVNALLAWAIAMLFHNGGKLAGEKPPSV